MTKIKDFSQDNRNANKGTARGQKMIVNSIQEDGFGRSVLADKNGVLIAGNKTLEASAEVFGVESEPIVVESDGTRPVVVKRLDLDLSDPDPNNPARRLAHRDNLTSHFSFSLDPAIVMADIEAGFDFEAIDISLPDLGEMLEGAAKELLNGNGKGQPEPEMPTETEAERLAKEYGVKVGQIWALGRHRLIVGDSTNEATRKEFVKGDEYLFTDPPYGIEVDTSWLSALHIQRGKPANLSDDKLQGDDGTLDLSFLFEFERRFVWGFPYIYDPKATGWIVWDKQPGVSERGIVTPVELASTTLRKGFDMVRLMWGGFYRAAGEERHPHPTQKPMGVFLPFIEDWTKEGDRVFDPFLGSGTTLLCCEKLGRVCTGFDVYPPYIGVTIHRWVQMTGQTPKLLTE